MEEDKQPRMLVAVFEHRMPLAEAIDEAIQLCIAFRRNAVNSGELFEDPFETLKAILAQGIVDAEGMRTHKCEYGENDYCIYCREDGRS